MSEKLESTKSTQKTKKTEEKEPVSTSSSSATTSPPSSAEITKPSQESKSLPSPPQKSESPSQLSQESEDSQIAFSPVDFTKLCEKLIKTVKDELPTMTIMDKKYQKVLQCIENKNKLELQKRKEEVLFPHLDDPNFTLKLSRKKEFHEVQIEKKTREQIDNIKEEANKLCNPNIEFELDPHQMFVRNFLSFQTPYNSLLIFHGLGTGKTCSSITVCEEMRTYYQQIGIKKKIMIVASPVVQENYKLQLFDERKLQKINDLWNIKACTGNKFIKEVNPMNMKGLTKNKIVKQIKKIIRQSYEFIGYIEFANKINNLIKIKKTSDKEKATRRRMYAIKKEFSDRLLVIDEVHNIRAKDVTRRTTQNMLELVTFADNIKLLLLTATPMFNDAKEIIWLTNLMNLNDKRFPIEIKDVFNKNGDFVKSTKKELSGKELLIQKITGYVSYVSGENPFTFPYRIWPSVAKNPHSLKKLQGDGWRYPSKQINGLEITKEMEIKYLDLVMVRLSEEQNQAYNYIIRRAKEKYPILNEKRYGIQYTVIDGPLQALNIVYPHEDLEKEGEEGKIESFLYGKSGLNRIMSYSKDKKKGFEYVEKIKNKFGRIFSSEGGANSPLKKYSSKIYSIISNIKANNEGIILIYSNYIDGGCVPVALALEEIGVTRYGGKHKSLFKTPPTKPFKIQKHSAKYIMITGDKQLSPNNKEELKAATDPRNITGEKVKVIIISKAGSEGLDFRNIRQVHALEPWFNLNRLDQIIGRAVRNKSHCQLPYNKRNVEIYLYGSELTNNTEPMDLYVYRLAEYKSIRIGKITRLLKENAIDCLLNKNQQDMIALNMNKTVSQTLSNNKKIKYHIGYKNNSIICDFMNCKYSCNPNPKIKGKITTATYTENFIIMNLEKILQRIRMLFKEHYIYEKIDLINRINSIKHYSNEQISMALHVLITDKNEYINDMLGRPGRLVNIGEYYLFQPLDVENKHITHLERKRPLDFKENKLTLIAPSNLRKSRIIQPAKIDKTKIIDNLLKQFKILQTPARITKKKNWTQAAAWAISNLVKYNEISKDTLLFYALSHLFDILPIDYKLEVLNILYSKTSLDAIFKRILKRVVQKFIIKTSDHTYYACADYDKSHSKFGYTLIKLDKSETLPIWKIIGNLGRSESSLLVRTFRYKNDEYNKFIGFLTHPTNSKNIVFKTKETQISPGRRTSTGQRCPSGGENRRVVYLRINKLAKNIKDGVKYIIKSKKSNRLTTQVIQSIYGDTSHDQIIDPTQGKSRENTVLFTETQLCAETEFLLRHLDELKINDKRWFFGTLEDSINNISTVPNRKLKV